VTFARLGRAGVITPLAAGAVLVLVVALKAGFSTRNIPLPRQMLGMLQPATVLPAKIEAFQTFVVAAESSGTVVSVLVAPGMQVKAGQSLVMLENETLRGELERARARFRFAEARLASARDSYTEGSSARLDQEQMVSMAKTRGGAQERLQAFSMEDAENAHASAKQRFGEIRSLLDQQLATRAELEEAQAREQSELRNVKAAREHRSRLEQEAESADAQMRMAQLQLRLNRGGAQRSAEADYADAKASLTAVTQQLRKQQVQARWAGTVLRIAIKPGDSVPAGAELLKIADLSSLTFVAPVSSRLARQILVGAPVAVHVPSEPPVRLPAKVSSVTPAPDPAQQAYLVRVTVPNPAPQTILVGLEGAVAFGHVEP
jgi:multidrug efflux pump subunit AcrA (membrane-fusion protein)